MGLLPPLAAKSPVWTKQVLALGSASAVLGTLCDNCHSRHDVLHYTAPDILLPPLLETCAWVPALFATAGIILGAAHPLLDQIEYGRETSPPGWTKTLLAISCFCICYELSGILAEASADKSEQFRLVDLPLAVNAISVYAIFERTLGGLFMAILTALVGPLVEMFLINVLHLYFYTHSDFFGTPSWICWVYACGSPAVGILGRQVLSVLRVEEALRQKPK